MKLENFCQNPKIAGKIAQVVVENKGEIMIIFMIRSMIGFQIGSFNLFIVKIENFVSLVDP